MHRQPAPRCYHHHPPIFMKFIGYRWFRGCMRPAHRCPVDGRVVFS